MRLSESLNNAFSEQVTHEMRNVLIYREMQSYLENLQLVNLAKYFENQADHENYHAKMIIDYVNSRIGGAIVIKSIDAPNTFSSTDDLVDSYVKAEEDTTKAFEDIYRLASDTNSYIDLPFLLGMLNEQVEEEDSALRLSVQMKNVKDIYLFDVTYND